MIIIKNFFLFALVNSTFQFLILFFDFKKLFASQISEDENFWSVNPILSFSGSDLPASIKKNYFEFSYLSIYENSVIILGVFIILFLLWYFSKPKQEKIDNPGFVLINFKDEKNFIPIKLESQSLEFLEDLKITKKFRLSANLNRVILSPHSNTFLLEDKNFKNALLINRRRLHRKILFNNDILDIGEMVLMYKNNLFFDNNINKELSLSYQKVSQTTKPKGPVQKEMPILHVSGSKQEIMLLRNLNTLGTSKINDIVIESEEIALRHSKIYKVGKSWKIQNLNSNENTFLNGRRIDQRFLKDGDEVAIGDFIFKFCLGKSKHKIQQKYVKKESKIKSL